MDFFSLSEASSRRDAEHRMPGDCTPCSAAAAASRHGDCNPRVRYGRQPHGAMSLRLYPLPYICLFTCLQLRPPTVAPLVKLRLVYGRYPQNNVSSRSSEYHNIALLLLVLPGDEESFLSTCHLTEPSSTAAAETTGLSQTPETLTSTGESCRRGCQCRFQNPCFSGSCRPQWRQYKGDNVFPLPCLSSQPSRSPFCRMSK